MIAKPVGKKFWLFKWKLIFSVCKILFFFTEARAKAAFLAIPSLLQEKQGDMVVTEPDAKVS